MSTKPTDPTDDKTITINYPVFNYLNAGFAAVSDQFDGIWPILRQRGLLDVDPTDRREVRAFAQLFTMVARCTSTNLAKRASHLDREQYAVDSKNQACDERSLIVCYKPTVEEAFAAYGLADTVLTVVFQIPKCQNLDPATRNLQRWIKVLKCKNIVWEIEFIA